MSDTLINFFFFVNIRTSNFKQNQDKWSALIQLLPELWGIEITVLDS
jgi:hypothetical protein